MAIRVLIKCSIKIQELNMKIQTIQRIVNKSINQIKAPLSSHLRCRNRFQMRPRKYPLREKSQKLKIKHKI